MSEIHAGPLPEAEVDGDHRPGPLPRASRLGRAADLWQAWRKRRQERRAARADLFEEHQPGPLPQARSGDEHHAGPLDEHTGPIATATRQQRYKKSWREKRWERRRRRRFTEEVLGWVLVPVILLSGYWAVKSGLNALGTNFSTLVQGIKTALSAAGKG